MINWKDLLATIEPAFSPSIAIKVVEAAKKYGQLQSKDLPTAIPAWTVPGEDHSWYCHPYEDSWTYGFLVGELWLLEEQAALGIARAYDSATITSLARRYQDSFRQWARHAQNHDQGFRFQLSFGLDLALTGNAEGTQALIDAANSLVDRYSEKVGCIRSWNGIDARVPGFEALSAANKDHHFITIIDTMMNLDLLYQVSIITGNPIYKKIATRQAEMCMKYHVREDYTTFHVVNYDPQTGEVAGRFTWQGFADGSTWSRGQAWAIYGFAQCAQRTGRDDFLQMSVKLADVFLAKMGDDEVPRWDFDAPLPTAPDASAGCIAARGLQLLYELLLQKDTKKAEAYLTTGFKLISNILKECLTPEASLKDGVVDWGKGGWEPLLDHSSATGNPRCGWAITDHALIFGDYYLLEFANAALKLKTKYAAGP
ncbi:glycoside hydrolase family 88 protein [Calocera viscosa TUFC12733]|uniref:Glycoside hydrolase family 88 protein n=1 Tax=Calocera viscosa (strain TUFC12733) TaxID=1330018 RepID=A0A167FLM2_CALVF|nr:glycoside hydrolase family 88 protein [Calocera viscosa TUFC12733]